MAPPRCIDNDGVEQHVGGHKGSARGALQHRVQNVLRRAGRAGWGAGKHASDAAGDVMCGARLTHVRVPATGTEAQGSALLPQTSSSCSADGYGSGAAVLQHDAGGSSHSWSQVPLRAARAPGSNSADCGGDDSSLATQAGSAAHSVSSLYSILTDAAAGEAATPGTHGRSSDAGGGDGASVSTLPLISEAGTAADAEEGYEDQLGHDVMGQTDEALAAVESRGSAGSCGSGGMHAARPAAVPGGSATAAPPQPLLPGQQRISSSHGSLANSIGETTSGPTERAVLGGTTATPGRMPQQPAAPRGFGGGFGGGGGGASGRSSALAAAPGASEQPASCELPVLPFTSRRRPDGDEACSYATQAGSVHSVSSVLSSAFAESSGIAGRPLSSSSSVHHAAAAAADGGGGGGSGNAPSASGGRVAAALERGERGVTHPGSCSSSGGALLQQRSKSSSLKGALRSVVAWGNGLSQRLQRASSSEAPGGGEAGRGGGGV